MHHTGRKNVVRAEQNKITVFKKRNARRPAIKGRNILESNREENSLLRCRPRAMARAMRWIKSTAREDHLARAFAGKILFPANVCAKRLLRACPLKGTFTQVELFVGNRAWGEPSRANSAWNFHEKVTVKAKRPRVSRAEAGSPSPNSTPRDLRLHLTRVIAWKWHLTRSVAMEFYRGCGKIHRSKNSHIAWLRARKLPYVSLEPPATRVPPRADIFARPIVCLNKTSSPLSRGNKPHRRWNQTAADGRRTYRGRCSPPSSISTLVSGSRDGISVSKYTPRGNRRPTVRGGRQDCSRTRADVPCTFIP